MSTPGPRQPLHSNPRRLLYLNKDVLGLILDVVPVEDACSFRLCSKHAAQVAAPRALGTQTLKMSDGLKKRIEDMMKKDDTSPILTCITDLTLVPSPPTPSTVTLEFTLTYPFPTSLNVPHIPTISTEAQTAAFAPVLCKLLRKTRGLRALKCDVFEELLASEPQLLQTISQLQSLETLTLSSTSAKTSDWLLGRADLREPGTLSRLIQLSITELNIPDTDEPSIPQLSSLRSLSVESLTGRVELLPYFAPGLTHIHAMSIDAPSTIPEETAHYWPSLRSVAGRPTDLSRLRPFYQGQSLERLDFSKHDPGADESRCIAEILSVAKPYCLNISTMKPSLAVYRQLCLSHIPQRLFYLCLYPPQGGLLEELIAMSKELKALLCLDLDLWPIGREPNASYRRAVHYFSCKIPSLRFILIEKHTGEALRRQEDYESRDVKSLMNLGLGSDRKQPTACARWEDGYMYGVRFVHGQSRQDDWIRGRYSGGLVRDQAERVRRAYRAASFETRFDVEATLFPGPLPSGPGCGATPSTNDLRFIACA